MRIPNFLQPSKIYNLQKSSQRLTRLQSWFSKSLKRAFDIFSSFVALVLFSPIFGLIALAIKRDSPGPVFYRGDRLGRNGKIFKILKFRTMYEAPESYSGPKVTAHDDTRITPLGRWLRDTKLNELPQFVNVLRGEMSMVGPRPEDPSIAKTWPREVWTEVLSVRPGITSPASVQYHNEESLLSFTSVMPKYMQDLVPDKIRLDQLYVHHRSFLLDLDVIFWTAMIMLPRIGSTAIPEDMLFLGPFSSLMRRYLQWFSIDFIVTLSAIGFTGLVYRHYAVLDVGVPKSILLALGFALLFSMSGAIVGVNRIAWSKANYADALDLLLPWFMATSVAVIVNYIFRFYPLELVIIASLLAIAGFVFTRYRSRLLTGTIGQLVRHWGKAEATRERVLIVGTGTAAQLAAWLFNNSMNAGKFWIVGFVDNDLFNKGLRVFGSKVIGTTKEVPDLVKENDVGVIVVTDQTIPTKDYQEIVHIQKETPLKLVILPNMMESLLGFADAKEVDTLTEIDLRNKVFVPCRYCLARSAALNMEKNKN